VPVTGSAELWLIRFLPAYRESLMARTTTLRNRRLAYARLLPERELMLVRYRSVGAGSLGGVPELASRVVDIGRELERVSAESHP
jgi:hypothetical protein